jgi:acyl carrier protein
VQLCGRRGDQVKVRGYRIELGEIEAALLESQVVGQAAVLAREDRPGEKCLVAYVVPAAGQQFNETALRYRLHTQLPEYMIPVVFVQLEALPLTPNGKVDRKALPAPDGEARKARDYIAPRTELEHKLALIWAEVLKVDRVGLTDNFFELGGHSLLAMQLIARIRESTGMLVSIRHVFDNPTITSLGPALESVQQLASTIGEHRDGFDTIEY